MTPWKVRKTRNDNSRDIVRATDDALIGTWVDNVANADENVALIVRAVNTQSDLVTTLKWIASFVHIGDNIQEACEQAIAKAEGKTS